jgi:hypothetical protein
MRKLGISIPIFVLLFNTIIVTESIAQRGMRWKGNGGWGRGSNYCNMFDTKTVETIKGEVISVNTFTPMKGMSNGVHIIVKTDKEKISVHLGPVWYLENQGIKIKSKDKIEIKGSRITYDDKPVIIAVEIKKGEDILKLRDDDGLPFWNGMRGR